MRLIPLFERMKQKRFIGGKRDRRFKIHVEKTVKIINPHDSVLNRLAIGAHGKIFDLVAYKDTTGKHAVNLVIKRFHSGNQSKQAKAEYKVFMELKKMGLPVPPTLRLVRIKGKYYIAMTDLYKFGDTFVKVISDLPKEVSETKKAELLKKVDSFTEDTRKKGIRLWDSWEYVYNSKTGELSAFIIDLGNRAWEDKS